MKLKDRVKYAHLHIILEQTINSRVVRVRCWCTMKATVSNVSKIHHSLKPVLSHDRDDDILLQFVKLLSPHLWSNPSKMYTDVTASHRSFSVVSFLLINPLQFAQKSSIRLLPQCENLVIFKAEPNSFLWRFVTMDETWVHHFQLEMKHNQSCENT